MWRCRVTRGRLLSDLKRELIGAFRDLHHNGVAVAGGAVVLGELGTKAAGLYADGGVETRVEFRRPAEDLRRNLMFPDWGARGVQRLPSQIPQQFAEGFRAAQHGTCGDSLDLPETLLATVQSNPCYDP